MEVSEAPKLKALEDESAKLKRLLADTMLDNVVLERKGRSMNEFLLSGSRRVLFAVAECWAVSCKNHSRHCFSLQVIAKMGARTLTIAYSHLRPNTVRCANILPGRDQPFHRNTRPCRAY